jgi:hypothetical protein
VGDVASLTVDGIRFFSGIGSGSGQIRLVYIFRIHLKFEIKPRNILFYGRRFVTGSGYRAVAACELGSPVVAKAADWLVDRIQQLALINASLG